MGIDLTMLVWPLLLAATATGVSGHGGMVWPPIWQDGHYTPLNKIYNYKIYSDPKVKDPNTGKPIADARSWLTDQAYIGGHGTISRPLACRPTTVLQHAPHSSTPGQLLAGHQTWEVVAGFSGETLMAAQHMMTCVHPGQTVGTLRGDLKEEAPGLLARAPSRSTSPKPRTPNGGGEATNGLVG